MTQANPFPYRFIAIEGNIGAGKTTLCQALARNYSCKLILETFADNPFLPLFYEDPERYALSVELFFMAERRQQLQQGLVDSVNSATFILSDYFIFPLYFFLFF